MARHWIDRTNGQYANPPADDVPRNLFEALASFDFSQDELIAGKHATNRRNAWNGRLADIAAWSDMRRLVHGKV